MFVGVISDTHGDVGTTRLAVRMFESLDVELVIHCGDVGSAEIISLFEPWPSHFVLGNVDRPAPLRVAISKAGQTCHERFGSLEIEGRRIAFLHGDDETLFRRCIQGGRCDLVCFGHTHVPQVTTAGRTLLLNPGAMVRTPQPSVAVVQLPELEVTPIRL